MKNSVLQLLVGLLFLMAYYGCANTNQESVVTDGQSESVITPDDFYAMPDDMLTPEQLQIRKKLEKISIFCTEAKDNKMFLTVGSDYFIENGIPVEFYDSMVEQYRLNNEFTQTMISTCSDYEVDVAALLEQNKADYNKYLAEVGENGISYNEYCKRRHEAFEKEVMGGQPD